MGMIRCAPNAGINRRYPEHLLKDANDKQYCQELLNMINLDKKTTIVGGASRANTVAVVGDIKWSKRIYYTIGGDFKKDQFAIADGKIYKLNEADKTLNQVTIDNNLATFMDQEFYPIDATIKVAEQVTTFLIDGMYFYKYNGNDSGNWEKLPLKQDVDGNDIEPVYIAEYLDRLWVLCKQRNVLLFSKNLNPENYSDSTDAGLIDLSPGKGGFPTGLIVHNGFLHVVHEDYIVPVTGSSVSTFGVRPGDYLHGRGSRAPRSILKLDEDFGFLNSTDNEYYIYSDLTTPLSYNLKLQELMNPVLASQTVAHLDTTLNCIRISYIFTGQYVLNAEEIYSRNEQKWCGQTRGRSISTYSQWNGRGDSGVLYTGRSDTGLLMCNDSSLNFDGAAIHYKYVTASYIADDDAVVQFQYFELDAKSGGDAEIPLSYHLDSLITSRGQEGINNEGEIISLGLIKIADQRTFLNRAVPFIDKRKGRMIRFQIEETVTNRVLELYGINVGFVKDQRIFSKYILGR